MRTVIALALFLAGCASAPPPKPPEPVIVTKEVQVPVSVPCRPMLPNAPAYPSPTDFQTAKDIFVAVDLYKADRKLRIQREVDLLAAIKACGG